MDKITFWDESDTKYYCTLSPERSLYSKQSPAIWDYFAGESSVVDIFMKDD